MWTASPFKQSSPVAEWWFWRILKSAVFPVFPLFMIWAFVRNAWWKCDLCWLGNQKENQDLKSIKQKRKRWTWKISMISATCEIRKKDNPWDPVSGSISNSLPFCCLSWSIFCPSTLKMSLLNKTEHHLNLRFRFWVFTVHKNNVTYLINPFKVLLLWYSCLCKCDTLTYEPSSFINFSHL